MRINGKKYRTIWYENNVVKIIDQTKLPHHFIIKDLKTIKDAVKAIKTMEVRGAPLIGGAAAYGIVLAIQENKNLDFIKKSSEELVNSRPTAINLQWAVHRMNNKLSFVKPNELLDVALKEAKLICDEDVKFCENIGFNGLKIIEEIYNKNNIFSAEMDMGDAILFNFKALHSSSGNSDKKSRKAFSARFIGDDVRYIDRKGETSPPFAGIDLKPGDKMRKDWFPVVWSN